MKTIAAACRRLAKELAARQVKVVFAESCTAGLVSASLSRVAGISDYLCGSAVTYRNDTKHRWLDVAANVLKRPGPVSRVVAAQMAEGVLRQTPEADWAASITGHLGPNAPPRLDGLVYIGIVRRDGRAKAASKPKVFRHVLSERTRSARQREAALLVLRHLCQAVEDDE